MMPDDYARSQLRTHAPAIYYGLLFAPAPARPAVTALYAWAIALNEIIARDTHLDVRQAKFGWWRQELAASFNGESHHPCMGALTPAIAAGQVSHAALLEILAAAERRLFDPQPQTYLELRARCLDLSGNVNALATRLFGTANEPALASAKLFGLGFALTDLVQNSGRDLRNGRINFARDDCARHQVTDAMLHAPAPNHAVRALIAEHVACAHAAFAEAESTLTPDDRPVLRMQIVRANLARRLLTEIARSDFNVLTQRIELPALRQLWYAWRSARTEARRAAIRS